MVDWSELLTRKLEEIPDGVAVWFIHDKLHPDTICFLVKAEGKNDHKFPSLDKLEILETGIAFFNPHDNEADNINAKGELMALGRALKAYHKKHDTRAMTQNVYLQFTNGSKTITLK